MKNNLCDIIGYIPVNIKDTGEEMFRICIAIDSPKEKYVGKESMYIFLPESEELKNNLDKYLNGLYHKCSYDTTNNILSKKKKVIKLNFE